MVADFDLEKKYVAVNKNKTKYSLLGGQSPWVINGPWITYLV
jgi:hypothetical protein